MAQVQAQACSREPPPDSKSGGNVPGKPLEEATTEEATTEGATMEEPEATTEEAQQQTPNPPFKLEAEGGGEEAEGSFPQAKRQRAATPLKVEAKERSTRANKPRRGTCTGPGGSHRSRRLPQGPQEASGISTSKSC